MLQPIRFRINNIWGNKTKTMKEIKKGIKISVRFKKYSHESLDEEGDYHKGHWCGYVHIPKGHYVYKIAHGDWYEYDYNILKCGDRQINYCQKTDTEVKIGFDCGHLNDTKITNTKEYATLCAEIMRMDAIHLAEKEADREYYKNELKKRDKETTDDSISRYLNSGKLKIVINNK